jgi:hypothetical protein
MLSIPAHVPYSPKLAGSGTTVAPRSLDEIIRSAAIPETFPTYPV